MAYQTSSRFSICFQLLNNQDDNLFFRYCYCSINFDCDVPSQQVYSSKHL